MRFIDFFSGIGGFRIGMERCGHKCVGHCEIDKYADISYRAMHTLTDKQRDYLLTLPLKDRQAEIRKDEYLNGEWYANDITRVLPGDLPEADCYCFGFPCQAFSIAGHRRGFEDTRGTLFFEVMRLAKERKPKILFAENVAGLLNHDGGGTFGTIINTMGELGYLVEWQLLNSKHFGVPQNRERVFIIGHFDEECTETIFPIGVNEEKVDKLQGYEVNQVGQLYDKNAQGGRVYDENGIMRTLGTGHAASEPLIANTLDTRIEGDTRGTYIADGGVLKVNGYHKA